MKRGFHLILVIGLVVWLSYALYNTRFAMLDDALIHMRYAVWLRKLHHVTYDGVHDSFGTSSLLYVVLLALFDSIVDSVLLPKLLSCAGYLVLIGTLLVLVHRLKGGQMARAILIALLLTTLSAMGIRWLTDGMETSIVVLAAVLLAIVIDIRMHRRSSTLLHWGLLVTTGFLLVLLRIELASLALLADLTILAGRAAVHRGKPPRYVAAFLGAVPLVIGAVLAMAYVRVTFGGLLPDTALAKTVNPSFAIAKPIMRMLLSSMMLGIGAALLYVISGALVLRGVILHRHASPRLLCWIFANCSFPLVVLLACLRGQAIKGIRYLLWTLFFAIVWNVLQLERDALAFPGEPLLSPAMSKALMVAYAGLVVCMVPIDGHYGMQVMIGRAATFTAMRGANLMVYHDQDVVAGDVGFIGYFSGGDICDIDGLVNGRKAALERESDRIRRCVEKNPSMLFLSDDQAKAVNDRLNIEAWIVCEAFDFVTVGDLGGHYLMVPGSTRSCPRRSVPLGVASQVVPGLRVIP